MALLIRPGNVLKNVAADFTLNLSELIALPKIPEGKYKNPLNWKKVMVRVVHSSSGQNKDITFNLPSTMSSLLLSSTARSGFWRVSSILIKDFDRGEIVLHEEDIPSVSDYNFYVLSSASHGDLVVKNGETVTIPANSSREYGDFIIEPGGVLQLEDGGGILDINVLGNCIINGLIKGNQGKHIGGTWTRISPLGETLTHTVVQKNGGNGGAGESYNSENGGTGGLAAFGNGGGGGRSAKFSALNGGNAFDVSAGLPAGFPVYADEYGENGIDSQNSSYSGGGGFRGAHGQCLYIKAFKIQGTGLIDVSGQKGGDGGDGAEYLSDGDLYANAPGGGGAGGEGGKVWLRAKKGTPALQVKILGGEKGSRGFAPEGATDAQHGEAGSNGSYSFNTY